jgi:hypothetical protein
MRFIYAKAGEPLEELAARAYDFEGTGSAGELRSAGQALRGANPFLRKLSAVQDGTLLIVPELEGAAPAEKTETPGAAAAALVTARLKDAAEQALELLTVELADETAAAHSSLEVLGSSDAKRLARNDDEAKVVTQATKDAVKARLAAAAGLGDYHSQVASQVESDLEELMGALRSAGGGQ